MTTPRSETQTGPAAVAGAGGGAADILVLGAGIIGVCVAASLAMRGQSVVIVDRRGPGEETSYGNAGLIQREGVYPYGFPHDFGALLRYAFNRTIDAYYHLSALPALAPFLYRYWRHSAVRSHDAIARLYEPLIRRCVDEHRAMAAAAGAGHLLRPGGWLKVFRTARERDLRFAEAARWKRDFGVGYRELTPDELATAEPFLTPGLAGALHWTDPWTVNDPHALCLAYMQLAMKHGARFVQANALSLESHGAGWRVRAGAGWAEGREAVIALGPWSGDLAARLGYDLPLAVKRGYHMHFAAAGAARLNHPVLDVERGYFLAPMRQGVRLTTGAEFALRDAPRTPVQLMRAEPVAREFFPLGERLEPQPWMGARPCTPDMLPVIGPAPRHHRLWFAFGHAHHGLTLGPVTGRLVAEMIAGETPFVDPAPFAASRFR
ncbi:NAD(P)/FAD-dependent oxidoreductase [Camelimonas abortus]|uniref:NAD(P)/FAD-dependent oxidoreductase n=1 Tax=Camelimonas abortus TaxID=1017184 RepID=A0ABV7LCV6_9HYPH